MTDADESAVLVYGIPFLGVVLLAVGLPAAVLGGYSVAQEELGLCGNHEITVYTADETQRLTDGPESPNLTTVALADLAPAEREAVETSLGERDRPAAVHGAFPHRQAFERGVLVTVDGTPHYATLVATRSCLDANPLLLPLGLVAVLLGVAGVLTPPAYRKLAAMEERTKYP